MRAPVRPAGRFICALALALVVLGGWVAPDKVDDLIQTLVTTDSYKVRVQVCLVLGRSGDRRAVPALSGALKDDSPAVRLVAAQALGRLGDTGAVPALNAALHDPVANVAAAARQALANLDRAASANGSANGGAKFFINVGPLSNRSRGGGTDAVKLFRLYLVRELKKTPNVSVDGTVSRGQTGYYVDGNIVRLTTQPAGAYSEVSCDLKVVVATWPAKSIIMWTDGGATVQVGASAASAEAGMRDCLEAAVQGVRENIATFLKAQK